MTTRVYKDARYTVKGYEGIAFWPERRCSEHHNCQVMVMVGDDRRHHINRDDLTRIDDGDYCSGCGQIGCGW